ncbi:MAG: hypothetical protein PWP58_676, partial [Bacillota bacterium]|nr:hypothetical protein [Bacillota bacterium]
KNWMNDWFWLAIEIKALEAAVCAWLTPSKQDKAYLYPKQRYILREEEEAIVAKMASRKGLEYLETVYSIGVGEAEGEEEEREFVAAFLEEYARWALFDRSREISAFLTIGIGFSYDELSDMLKGDASHVSSPDFLGYWYEAPGLLHLAWLEVAWALMNDQYAHKCDVCGGVFALDRPYTRPAYICSKECAKAWRVQKAGGLDALRAYNREAQRRHRAKERQKVK